MLELAAVNAPGDAGITRKELRAKLSKLCRSSDPNVSLKAIAEFQKFESAEKAELAVKADDRVDPDQADADLIAAIPVGGVGAAICLGFHYNRAGGAGVGRISKFTFLEEVAPLVSRKFPENWQRWRSALEHPTLAQELAYVDKCAAGPLLEADALIAAVRAKCPKAGTRKVKITAELGENDAA